MPKKQRKSGNFAVFYNFSPKNFGSSRKSSTFAPAKQNKSVLKQKNILGYGVMVTLQILVLPFLVRVRVPQPNQKELQSMVLRNSFSLILHLTRHIAKKQG